MSKHKRWEGADSGNDWFFNQFSGQVRSDWAGTVIVIASLIACTVIILHGIGVI